MFKKKECYLCGGKLIDGTVAVPAGWITQSWRKRITG